MGEEAGMFRCLDKNRKRRGLVFVEFHPADQMGNSSGEMNYPNDGERKIHYLW